VRKKKERHSSREEEAKKKNKSMGQVLADQGSPVPANQSPHSPPPTRGPAGKVDLPSAGHLNFFGLDEGNPEQGSASPQAKAAGSEFARSACEEVLHCKNTPTPPLNKAKELLPCEQR